MAYRIIRIQLLLTMSQLCCPANCLLQGRDYKTGIYCSQTDDLMPLPLRLSGPFIVYMLRDIDILEDWTAIKKVKKPVATFPFWLLNFGNQRNMLL